MSYAFRVDGKPTSTDQAIKLGRMANISTSTMRRKAMFTDRIQGRMSNVRASEEDYVIRFIYMGLRDVAKDKTSSNFLAANSKVANILYTKVSKMMIKQLGVLHLLARLGKDAPAPKMFASRTLMSEASKYFLRRASFSRFRPLARSLGTTKIPPILTRITLISTPWLSMMSYSMDSWSNTKRLFCLLRVF